MNDPLNAELPPVDFVAFLAQRSGLSQEAAETRLEHWFGEYHAASGQRSVGPRSGQRHAR